jgi:ABC-type transport system involved in cytochrome bd biosynthesis fused ATPase/permease subunit
MPNKNCGAFVEAYNNFNVSSLKNENLETFYSSINNTAHRIASIIQVSKQFKRILLMGQAGCGKSTALNKVSKELAERFYVVPVPLADKPYSFNIQDANIASLFYRSLER